MATAGSRRSQNLQAPASFDLLDQPLTMISTLAGSADASPAVSDWEILSRDSFMSGLLS